MPTNINHIVNQAWIAFWHSCMHKAGGQSLLPLDMDALVDALAGQQESAGLPAVTVPAAPKQFLKSQLAQMLEGDERISEITLADVLVGLDNYFNIFRQVKKLNPPAYEYFSRVGVPLCLSHAQIYKGHIDDNQTPITDPKSLPAYLGLFFPRSDEEARADWIENRPAFLDFHIYEKRRRNLAVPSAWKYTIYDHTQYHLHRDIMTKAEQRKHDYFESWGYHYFIGIDGAGMVQALPMHSMYHQLLPKGGIISHKRFAIPRGLYELAGQTPDGAKRSVHTFAAIYFAVVRAFAASALMGVQLSIRRGKQVARFGVPLSHTRSFFRDRDPTGNRRNPILHFVGTYAYTRANGKLVTVGEHLRGARHFTWRDYSIVLSAPGIHHPSPEGLHVESLQDDDLLPMPETGLMSVGDMANVMQSKIESRAKVPFRRGKPTVRYHTHSLDRPIPPDPDGKP